MVTRSWGKTFGVVNFTNIGRRFTSPRGREGIGNSKFSKENAAEKRNF